MKIEYEDRIWRLDLNKARYKQVEAIQAHTGMSFGEWQESLSVETDENGETREPPAGWYKSMACLYWLMLDQNGEAADLDDIDFEFGDFLQAFMVALLAEVGERNAAAQAGGAAAVPTRPAGRKSPARPSRPATTRTGPGNGGSTGTE